MPAITPDEIRQIRTRLGLSQRKAGEILGGGPQAFHKYESGIVKPAAAVVHLLQLLNRDPSRLSELTGQAITAPHPRTENTGVFEVTAEDMVGLNRYQLVSLLKRMLEAELVENGIEPTIFHIPTNIDVPDGGEDGRLEWAGAVDQTKNLPDRKMIFQSKATSIGPKAAAKTLLDSAGQPLERIKTFLEQGGTYVLLSNHQYVQQAIEKREQAMRSTARSSGIIFNDNQIVVWDAHRLARFAQTHIGVVTWLLEQVQPGRIGPFQSLDWWAGQSDNQTVFCDDARLAPLEQWLNMRFEGENPTSRIVGLSGTGKSRLTLEAIRQNKTSKHASRIAYVNTSQSGDNRVLEAVSIMTRLGLSGILIVDDCSSKLHEALVPIISHEKSRLRLLTMDFDVDPSNSDDAIYQLAKADNAVSEELLQHLLPNLTQQDREKIALFADGIPRMATLFANSWEHEKHVAHLDNDTLADRLLFGRTDHNEAEILTARLIATIGIVGIEGEVHGDIDQIAELADSLTAEMIHRSIQTLIKRGIVQQRGRFISLHPLPLALSLAAQQWESWRESKWQDVLLEDGVSSRLKRQMVRRLSLLDQTEIGVKVGEYICRPGSPLTSLDTLFRDSNIEVISALAEIVPERAIAVLERALEELSNEDLLSIQGRERRNLVEALEKLCFRQITFRRAARLMLSLAGAENEHWGNNATGQFKELFQIILAGTEAGPNDRFDVVNDALAENDPVKTAIVIDALAEGLREGSFFRTSGAEQQGSGKALVSWRPQTQEQQKDYWSECIDWMMFIIQKNTPGRNAALEHLAIHLPSLIGCGLIDKVEEAIDTLLSIQGPFWSAIAGTLHRHLKYHGDDLEADQIARIEALIDRAKPQTLQQKLELVQTKSVWDLPCGRKDDEYDECEETQVEFIRSIAMSCAEQPDILKNYLPALLTGEQGSKGELGKHLADTLKEPMSLVDDIVDALSKLRDDDRNHALLVGLLIGIDKKSPETVDAFLDRVANSDVLVRWLPQFTTATNIEPSDLQRVSSPLKEGKIPWWSFRSFCGGGALDDLAADKVGTLIDQMLDQGEDYFAVALDMLGMYVFKRPELLEQMRPNLCHLAEAFPTERSDALRGQMTTHHLETLMKWLIIKGSSDSDAIHVSRVLTTKLITLIYDGNSTYQIQRILKPLLAPMLEHLPEIVWPILGAAITEKPQSRFYLTSVLGDSNGTGITDGCPIRSMPEEILISWCHAHPDAAPAFLISTLPALGVKREDEEFRTWYPLIMRILDDFGDNKEVLDSLSANMGSYSWRGSRTGYYALYIEPLKQLTSHASPTVRRWADRQFGYMQQRIDDVSRSDDETNFFYGD